MENKNNNHEELKGCLFPSLLAIVMVVMTLFTITCVDNRIRIVEGKQDAILKAINNTEVAVDSMVDSTATDSMAADSAMADDEYCEDCENGDEDYEDDDSYSIWDENGKRYDLGAFVCSGRYAKKYHIDKNCRGLQSCKGTIRFITLREARGRGMQPCRMCIPRVQ